MLRRNTKSVAAQQKWRTGVYVMPFLNLFISAGRALSDWRRQRRAYDELMALDDRALADIGICRSEIRSVLAADRKAARSAPPAASQQPAVVGRRQAA